MNRGKDIANLYLTGGPNLLAYRLGHIFTHISTDDERALHNSALAEVMEMTDDQVKSLLQYITDLLLYKKPRPKRFLFRVAEKILELGRTKG